MFRPLILDEYLDAVTLRCARATDDTITGFLGVADNKIEMLFIDPALMGQGIGRLLLDVAVRDLGATLVDVNEQNPDAVGFYLHYDFELVSRDPLDGLGKPYPILHLALPGGRTFNGASDLMAEVLGEAGAHARFAVGAPNLPFNFSVEIDAVFEILQCVFGEWSKADDHEQQNCQ